MPTLTKKTRQGNSKTHQPVKPKTTKPKTTKPARITTPAETKKTRQDNSKTRRPAKPKTIKPARVTAMTERERVKQIGLSLYFFGGTVDLMFKVFSDTLKVFRDALCADWSDKEKMPDTYHQLMGEKFAHVNEILVETLQVAGLSPRRTLASLSYKARHQN